MRIKLFLVTLLITNSICGQNAKDNLLERDISFLVEEMLFMYDYDQALREYTRYKTFDKNETNRIENLNDSLRQYEIVKRKFISDSLKTKIWKDYINPKDAVHTERMIEIIKIYGYPNKERINKYYKKEITNKEFSAFLLLIHSPKEFWKELEVLMKIELEEGRINECAYGYLLWHVTGRKSFKPMLDNGYEMVIEDGKTRLMSTCK